MSVCCPKCGSRMLNLGKSKTISERWAALRGINSLRCVDCKHRFSARTFVPSDLRYACCPRCYRMDLNLWSDKEFVAAKWMSLLIALGAKRYRCEYCRLNFASFRARKEIFSFRRWAKFAQETAKRKAG